MDGTPQSRNAIPHSAFHPDVSLRVLEIIKKLQQDKINAKPIDDRRDNETGLSEAPENPGDYMPREGVSSDFVDLIDEALEDEENIWKLESIETTIASSASWASMSSSVL